MLNLKLLKSCFKILDKNVQPLELLVLYPVSTFDLTSKKLTIGEDLYLPAPQPGSLLKSDNEGAGFRYIVGGLA